MTALGDQIIARARSYIGHFTDGPDVPVLAHDVGQAFPDLATYCEQATNTTAWCGIFVAKVLSEFGIRPPDVVNSVGFMWVDRWISWGTPVPFGEAEPGDVQIFVGSPHHVNFYPGVGGNQGDAVTEHKYRTPNYVRRAPQPGASTAPSPVSIKRNLNITATFFSDKEGNKTTAYADVGPGWTSRPGVALPWRFHGARPKVRVTNNATGKSVVCDIVDQGPWNYTSSKYPGDPYWQTGARPEAESGTDQSGRHTNGAGIDLTPAAAQAIGLNGKGLVDWEFTENTMTDISQPTPTPPPSNSVLIPPSQNILHQIIAAAVQAELNDLQQHPEKVAALLAKVAAGAKLLGGTAPPPQPDPAPAAPVTPPAAPKTGFAAFLDLFGGGANLTAITSIATAIGHVILNQAGVVGAPTALSATGGTVIGNLLASGALAGTTSALFAKLGSIAAKMPALASIVALIPK